MMDLEKTVFRVRGLKACPFCGGYAELIVREPMYGKTGAQVECTVCGAQSKNMKISEFISDGKTLSTPITENSREEGKQKAIEAWNRRADNGEP